MIAWPVGEPIASGGAIYESNEGDNRITLEIGASDGGNPNQPQTRRTFLPMLSTPIGVPSSGFEGALSFRPRPNGFSFQNYGGPTDQSSVLTPDELARMFGANKVCENGALPCVLNGPARQWRDKWVKSLNGGQCYGMAVTASRFTEGSDNPGKFTAGATTIFGIEQTRAVEQHIAYYFITQALAPENLALGGWITDKKPSEYIQIMREGFAKNQSYVIGFFKRNKTGGHAVTPYAIKNMGNGLVRLLVYDNNWPDQERFFEFDLNRETWSYNFGTTRPGEPVDLYEGDDRTNTFQIRPITSHPETGWQCPFCQDTPGLVSTQAVSDTIAFQYNGEGRILLIDPQGKRLGYNPTTRQTLSEIRGQGVTEQPFLGGLGKEIPPYIELPYLESTTTSTRTTR